MASAESDELELKTMLIEAIHKSVNGLWLLHMLRHGQSNDCVSRCEELAGKTQGVTVGIVKSQYTVSRRVQSD